MPPRHSRDEWLAQSDEQLVAECLVDTYRASGPGGQKRNKISSAVRLRHAPSGLSVIAEESRSQHENRARALRRLRAAIALRIRRPVEPDWTPPAIFAAHCTAAGRLEISMRNPGYPQIVAWVLDVLEACAGSLRDSSRMLGLGTAQLSRFLAKDEKLRAAANQVRIAAGLGALRDR